MPFALQRAADPKNLPAFPVTNRILAAKER